MVALVLGIGTWGALSWSLIPTAIDARVDDVEDQSETGYRFRQLILDDGRTLVVDRQMVDAIGRGDLRGRTLQTSRWSTTLRSGDRSMSLQPSPAFWQVTASLVILSFLGLRPWRARTARTSSTPSPPTKRAQEG